MVALLAIAAPSVSTRLAKTDFFAGMLPLWQALETQPHVMNARVQRGWQSFNGQPATHYLRAQLRLDAPMTDDAGYARGVALVMVKGDPHLSEENTVALYYDFNIGIASWWNRSNYSFKPQDLQ